MDTKFLGDFDNSTIRGRYYDFNNHPELIREVLEDFKEWEHFQGVQLFYEMLEWVNGPASHFETNDCTMKGPHPNAIKAVSSPLTGGGRLMFFFRELRFNLSEEKVSWLREMMQYILESLPGNDFTYAQLCFFETLFTELPGTELEKIGKEVVIEFWAWGGTNEEVMSNFKLIVSNILSAFKQLSAEIRESLDDSQKAVSV